MRDRKEQAPSRLRASHEPSCSSEYVLVAGGTFVNMVWTQPSRRLFRAGRVAEDGSDDHWIQ